MIQRIVITGGPGAGKTVISRAVAELNPKRLVRVPESATQVYARWQCRWDEIDVPQRREVQRQIYALQRAQEDELAAKNPGKVLLLDRGTIDGSCYWPDGPEAYWVDLKSNRAVEMAPYDAVIWLESGAAVGVYDGDESNACRWEDAAAAVEAGELLKRVWGGHRKLFQVKASTEFAEKTQDVARIVNELIGTK